LDEALQVNFGYRHYCSTNVLGDHGRIKYFVLMNFLSSNFETLYIVMHMVMVPHKPHPSVRRKTRKTKTITLQTDEVIGPLKGRPAKKTMLYMSCQWAVLLTYTIF